jgi:transcription initiation factor TFIIIB Brf1 subunit/transcription initiation factor TFIIB
MTLLAVACVLYALVVKGQYRTVRPVAKAISVEQMKRS